jgi:hypothetical protein
MCGATDVDLEVCHIVPRAAGGSDDIVNLTVLCSTHHRELDRRGLGTLREFEFVGYLAELLRLSPDFEDVTMSPRLPGRNRVLRPDLFAREHTREGTRGMYIECKPYQLLIEDRTESLVAQLTAYRDAARDESVVLALPGALPTTAMNKLTRNGIEIWDQSYLSQRFAEEVPKSSQQLLRVLLGKRRPKALSTEEHLKGQLKGCAPGRGDWPSYQKLVGEILERLFCPPLATPIPERPDAFAINRRDYILPNYAEEGYWAFLRSNYHAHFVIVDAKNYVRGVTKKEALQIANYLKHHGAGLFGLIFSRKGSDRGCDYTLRELWAVHQKMVIILTDSDVEQMLDAKATGLIPEEVIRQKIEDFRLSM